MLPEEWQTLFRDGPKLFHKGPLPKGYTHNAPPEFCEVDNEIQQVFRLNF